MKLAQNNSHELSNQFWIALNKYSSLVDGRLERCYSHVPTTPGFWDVQRDGKLIAAESCPLGPLPEYGIDGGSKRSALLQYSWAPDAPSMSAECSAYAKELASKDKNLANMYGVYGLNTLTRPDPKEERGWDDDLGSLPKTKLRTDSILGASAEPAATRKKKTKSTKRSVLMALFDALGRANYHRLLSPSVVAAVAEGVRLAAEDSGDHYNMFDFTRFHVVAHNSKRNYQVVYAGHLPELFEGLLTGETKSPYNDKDVCEVEADEVDAATNEGDLDAALARLAGRCRDTLWGYFRDRGYLTVDMAVESGDLGEYFHLCLEKCADSRYSERWGNGSSKVPGAGLGWLLAADPPYKGTWNGAGKTLRALAGAFHSLTKPGGPPVFGTQHSLDSHNKLQDVHALAYQMKGFIKALRASATTRGVPLPLVVLHADHGSHYGNSQLTRAGRIEHKFPLLLMLVPETMLKRTPGLRERLHINRRRLISAFDLHHTLKEYAGGSEEESTGHRKNASDLVAAAGIRKIDFFKMLVPKNRSCQEAGVENFLCVCDAWVRLEAAIMPAAAHLAERFAVPYLNGKVKEMMQMDATGSVTARCASTLSFSGIRDGKTSSSPPSLQTMLAVKAGAREVMFLISMICHNPTSGQLRVVLHGKAGGKSGERFVPKRSSICRVSTVERVSLMSKAEDEVYKAMGEVYGDGKMCVVEGAP
jgi:hypothetical protein